jgi:hypothetical protein
VSISAAEVSAIDIHDVPVSHRPPVVTARAHAARLWGARAASAVSGRGSIWWWCRPRAVSAAVGVARIRPPGSRGHSVAPRRRVSGIPQPTPVLTRNCQAPSAMPSPPPGYHLRQRRRLVQPDLPRVAGHPPSHVSHRLHAPATVWIAQPRLCRGRRSDRGLWLVGYG